MPSLDRLGQAVADVAAGAGLAAGGELPSVDMLLLQQVGGPFGFGWKDTAWVDLKAPVYLALTKQGMLVYMPVKDLGAALKAMPEACSPATKPCAAEVGEHLTAYRHNNDSFYVDLVGHHLVFSPNSKAFAAVQTASKSIVRWAPSNGGDVFFAADGIRKHYAKQLRAISEELKRELSGSLGPMADAGAFMQFLLDAFAETDWIRISVARGGERAATSTLTAGLRPKGGSGLAKLFDGMKTAKLPWPEIMPAETFMGVLADMDLTGWAPYDTLVTSQSERDAAMVKAAWGDKAIASYQAVTLALRKASTGKMWFGFHADSRFPMGLSALVEMVGVAADVRSNYLKAVGLMLPGIWKEFARNLPGEELPKPTLKSLVKWANKGLKSVGLKLSVVRGRKGGVVWDGLKIQAHKAKKAIKKDASLSKLHGALDAVSGKLELALAFGNNRMSVTFGPSAVDRARALVGDSSVSSSLPSGSPPTLAKRLNAAMFSVLDLARLFDVLSNTPLLGSSMPPSPFPQGGGVVLSGGVFDGEGRLSLSLPDGYIKPVMDYFRIARGPSDGTSVVAGAPAAP